jgi:hypothetical protein
MNPVQFLPPYFLILSIDNLNIPSTLETGITIQVLKAYNTSILFRNGVKNRSEKTKRNIFRVGA